MSAPLSPIDPASPLAAPYAERLASSASTPGGGSASAVTATLAASLAAMVLKISLESADATTRNAPATAPAQWDELRASLLDLGAADETAYATYMAAFRLPRSTADEKEARSTALRAAALHATDVPLRIAESARFVLQQLPNVIAASKPSLVSDLIVAAHLSRGAGEASLVMANVNLDSLQPGPDLQPYIERSRQLAADIPAAFAAVLESQP